MSQKVLVIGPSWVGDMVMAQALFKLLKQQNRAKTIDVLAPPATISLLERMPEVDKAILLPVKHGELKLMKRFSVAKKLRRFNYDRAIVLTNSFKSALIPWLAHIKRRTGWLGELRYFLLNDIRRLDKHLYPLMIDQFMALGLEKTESMPFECFYPSFPFSDEKTHALREKYKNFMQNRPILALAGGAAFGPAKRWPATYFADVANHQLKAGWDVWLFGSLQDKSIGLQIMTETKERCENFVGRLNLAETIDLLSLVNGIVSNDSGLMHVACALKKPIIAIYGSTDPSFTPPLSNEATILKLQLECQPCFKRHCQFGHYRCLYDLKPDRVINAISAWKIKNAIRSP